ncbi:XAB2 [Auxenochlorella protothecoides x Auxenochlorella symbiontica]|uniref:Pre-mRNA-splicing factor SYF1 n=1 Tax=Auxenochlorella protothecoides TaxID=3075 RepID=A0A1D2A725_AUXPR
MAPASRPNGSDAPENGIDSLLPDEADLLYEEELLRNPYSLRMWVRYLDARKSAPTLKRRLLYERALEKLPGSYKLWHAYLQERRQEVRDLSPAHPALEALNNVYERALVSMHKMPRIWAEYLEFLVRQAWVTRCRRAFDRALMALPVTQHARVWPAYLAFISHRGTPQETAVRIYRRYLRFEPAHAEEYVAYLTTHGRWGEAAARLALLVNDEGFRSLEGKSKHALWLELCDIITRHPQEVKGLKVDAILRSGIRKFTNEVGRLWTSLADYYIRRGLFERARDVYEEGLASVVTVRDFSLVFDALTQFEESLISAKLEQEGEGEEEEDPAAAGDGDDFLLTDTGADLDLRLARLEALMQRRPELLSSVVLRQNPHNVHEWHKRAKLFAADPTKQILCYTEAVRTVDPDKAVGKVHSLWVAFAKLYEQHGDLVNARFIYGKAAEVPYKYVDDLATIYCEWAEMEMRAKAYKKALALMRTATTPPQRPRTREEENKLPVQERLYRSLRLWSLLVDLEESLGDLASTRAVYETVLDLKIATPQIVLNYAAFLQESKYWEDSFRVYERGVALFKYPHVKDIWQAYLAFFNQRYGGKKVERARDLYRQAIDEAPPEESKPLFLQYAAFEEKHGLARNAMQIYEEAVQKVPVGERLSVYDVYLARASEFFGIGKVREVYETAIEAQPPFALSDADTRTLCLRYAHLEQKLGEVDRARAIYVHASALADPRRDAAFWSDWNAFEVQHGHEETFREMLRIKRSVAASFSQTHFNTTVVDAVAVAAKAMAAGGAPPPAVDDMAALEAELAAEPAGGTRLPGFVSAGVIQQGDAGQEGGEAAAAAAVNPEDIELDEEEEEEGEPAALELEQKEVPQEVFGSLAPPAKKSRVDA